MGVTSYLSYSRRTGVSKTFDYIYFIPHKSKYSNIELKMCRELKFAVEYRGESEKRGRIILRIYTPGFGAPQFEQNLPRLEVMQCGHCHASGLSGFVT